MYNNTIHTININGKNIILKLDNFYDVYTDYFKRLESYYFNKKTHSILINKNIVEMNFLLDNCFDIKFYYKN
jgi:hypothetical protein